MAAITFLPKELFIECCLVSNDRSLRGRKKFCVRRQPGEIITTTSSCSYLSYKDWVNLDAAFINKKNRKDYLALIEGCHIPYPEGVRINHTKFLLWVCRRKLKLFKAVLESSTLESLQTMQRLGDLSCIEEFIVHTPRRESFHATCAVIIGCRSRVTSLNFSYNDRITCPAIKSILKSCTNIENLSLRSCRYINDHVLPHLANFAPKLLRLDLSKCIISNEQVLEHLSRLKQLKLLNLSSCPISYRVISALVPYLPQLEELYIDNLMGSLQRTMPTLTSIQIDLLQEHLSIYGSKFVAFSMQECSLLMDSHVLSWLRTAVLLRYVSFESCSKLTDKTLITIAHSCPQLKAINLRDCAGITDDGVIHLAISCHQLIDVALDGCFQLTSSAILAFIDRKRVRVTYSNCNRIQV